MPRYKNILDPCTREIVIFKAMRRCASFHSPVITSGLHQNQYRFKSRLHIDIRNRFFLVRLRWGQRAGMAQLTGCLSRVEVSLPSKIPSRSVQQRIAVEEMSSKEVETWWKSSQDVSFLNQLEPWKRSNLRLYQCLAVIASPTAISHGVRPD